MYIWQIDRKIIEDSERRIFGDISTLASQSGSLAMEKDDITLPKNDTIFHTSFLLKTLEKF